MWELVTLEKVKADYSKISLVVATPHDFHSAALVQLYALGVPLLVPSLDLLGEQNGWSEAQPPLELQTKEFCAVPSTNAHKYWLQHSEIYQWPHLFYFDSFSSGTLAKPHHSRHE